MVLLALESVARLLVRAAGAPINSAIRLNHRATTHSMQAVAKLIPAINCWNLGQNTGTKFCFVRITKNRVSGDERRDSNPLQAN
jgi:hypothetical protein